MFGYQGRNDTKSDYCISFRPSAEWNLTFLFPFLRYESASL